VSPRTRLSIVGLALLVGLVDVDGARAQAPGAGSPESSAAATSTDVPPPDVPAEGAGVAADDAVPVLAAIDIEGLVYFRRETFLSFLRSRVGAPLDLDMIDDDALAVADQYRARGFLQAEVTASVLEAADGLHARFIVVAGERAEL
jgi:hypothetical protein